MPAWSLPTSQTTRPLLEPTPKGHLSMQGESRRTSRASRRMRGYAKSCRPCTEVAPYPVLPDRLVAAACFRVTEAIPSFLEPRRRDRTADGQSTDAQVAHVAATIRVIRDDALRADRCWPTHSAGFWLCGRQGAGDHFDGVALAVRAVPRAGPDPSGNVHGVAAVESGGQAGQVFPRHDVEIRRCLAVVDREPKGRD